MVDVTYSEALVLVAALRRQADEARKLIATLEKRAGEIEDSFKPIGTVTAASIGSERAP